MLSLDGAVLRPQTSFDLGKTNSDFDGFVCEDWQQGWRKQKATASTPDKF